MLTAEGALHVWFAIVSLLDTGGSSLNIQFFHLIIPSGLDTIIWKPNEPNDEWELSFEYIMWKHSLKQKKQQQM